MNLRIQWHNKKFEVLVDSGAIKNYILPKIAERLGIPCRQKKYLYPLVMILGDPISYKNKIIHIKIELVELRIKGRTVIINFNILLLGKDKAVLGMP